MEETSSPTAVLQDLKDLGVRLMLDDFGTGYSSLNHVKRFPIEAIKVDREFCAGVVDDAGDRHILRAIVSMASAMDVAVVAEGVESAEQARWLRHLGIGLVQGYAFGRPRRPPRSRRCCARAAARPPRARVRAADRRARRRCRPRPRGLTEPPAPAAAGRRDRDARRGRRGARRLQQHRAPLGRHGPHPGRAHERRPPPLPRLRAAPPQRRDRDRDTPRAAPRRAAHRAAARAARAARRRRRRARRGGRARPLRRPRPRLVRLRRRARAARARGRPRSPRAAASPTTTPRSTRPAGS